VPVEPAQRQRARRTGREPSMRFDDFLTMPAMLAEILRAVDRVLSGSAAMRLPRGSRVLRSQKSRRYLIGHLIQQNLGRGTSVASACSAPREVYR